MAFTDPPPTPNQARNQLAAVGSRTPARPQDRRIYAAATAVLGLVMGVNAVARPTLGVGMFLTWTAFTFLLFLAGIWLVQRRTRSVPRHAWRWVGAGYLTSFLVGLWVVSPMLNRVLLDASEIGPALATGAWALTAAPCILAALMILRPVR